MCIRDRSCTAPPTARPSWPAGRASPPGSYAVTGSWTASSRSTTRPRTSPSRSCAGWPRCWPRSCGRWSPRTRTPSCSTAAAGGARSAPWGTSAGLLRLPSPTSWSCVCGRPATAGHALAGAPAIAPAVVTLAALQSWPGPAVPRLPGTGIPLRIWDTATGELRPTAPGSIARMYVCGITPYDATHLGHAATYLAFDLLQRVWLDGGLEVAYVQNVTDVDDPLLVRAAETGDD